ncbi:MAG: hypothetical protein ACOCZQ_01080 [Nanoarchaeota archaeon]
MALFQIILVAAAIFIIIWMFITLAKSTLKIVWSIVLGVVLLLIITGALLYLDYKELKEDFEGEENLFVLHENESIILSSAIIMNNEKNQTFQVEPGEIDTELNKLFEGNATDKNYNMIVSIEKSILEEGLNDSVQILGTNISKEIYFEILHGKIDADAFSAATGSNDIEEKISGIIDTEINTDIGIKNIALVAGLKEVRKEQGTRWFLDKYSEGYIKILPEPFILKLVRFLPL